METKFKIFKEEIIKRCKKHSACKPEFKRVLESENFEQITKVLTDNFNWSCNNGILDAELIEPLNEVLLPFNLCANISEGTNVFIILSGSSSAELSGSSSAKLFDSSSAELFDSSSAELFGSSSAELSGSSSAKLFGSSSAELFGSSSICSFNSIEHKLNDKAICRYYYENRIKVSLTTKIDTY